MESTEGGAMAFREITDTRSVPSLTSAAERPATIAACNKEDDCELTMRPVPRTRELAARDCDGIHVVLLWHPDHNALTVSVEDVRAGERFQLAVAPDRALDAFNHPFAYAA
jgi:hypothetical protein